MHKASAGDGIPAELFQILKGDAVRVLHSICQQIWKTQQWSFTGLEKIRLFSFHSQRWTIPRKFKVPYNCTHFICQQGNTQNPSSQASTVHELRTSRCTCWIQKRKRNQRSDFQHLLDHRKSNLIPEKKSTSALLTMINLLMLCASQQTVENS